MRGRRPVIAVCTGEPAGIGPELCAGLDAGEFDARLVLIGDRELLGARAGSRAVRSSPEVLHVPLAVRSLAGRLDPANSRYVLAVIDRAIDGCLGGEFDAMATAPVHKGVINDAGIAFTGHTEYLAARTGAEVVMMLAGGGLRVAVATTHLALSAVPAAITRRSLETVLRVIERDLRLRFGVARPRILVAGLNPHGGEGGHLGREEIEVIAPVIAALAAEGFALEGPIPADTLFVPERLAGADCALAMYHDQGLPVLKYASFGQGVNITLGLPFVRTSVDHGTALELAGAGQADPGSLVEAIRLAIRLSSSG